MVTLFFGGAGSARLPGARGRPPRRRRHRPTRCRRASGHGSARWCSSASWSPWGSSSPPGLAVVSAWVTATGHGTVIAIAVIVFGLGLVAAAFAGDIRRRIVPLLVVAGIVLGTPAAAVAAADIHIDESIGERTYTPTVTADIPADGYKLGTGQLIVDLRRLPWKNGQTISASAHLGIGQMIVSVPANVCIDRRCAREGGRADRRRPGHPGGRPGYRPGLTAHRCTDAQGERRYPVRADAGSRTRHRIKSTAVASTTTTTSRKRTPRGRSAGDDPPTVRRPDSSALGAGISILALGVVLLLQDRGVIDLQAGLAARRGDGDGRPGGRRPGASPGRRPLSETTARRARGPQGLPRGLRGRGRPRGGAVLLLGDRRAGVRGQRRARCLRRHDRTGPDLGTALVVDGEAPRPRSGSPAPARRSAPRWRLTFTTRSSRRSR